MSKSSPTPAMYDTSTSTESSIRRRYVESPHRMPQQQTSAVSRYSQSPSRSSSAFSSYNRNELNKSPARSARESATPQLPDSPKQRTRELARRIEERRRKRQQLLASQGSKYEDNRSIYSRQTSDRSYNERSFASHRTPRSYTTAERQHLAMPMETQSDFVGSTPRRNPDQYSKLFDSKPWTRPRSQSPSNTRQHQRTPSQPNPNDSMHQTDVTVHSFNSRYLEAAQKITQSPARTYTSGYSTRTPNLHQAQSHDSMSTLLARLNAIDRQNPEQALKEIDEILNNETQGFHEDELKDPEDEEGSSDDDTSVSSITNPTFQEHRPTAETMPQVRQKSHLGQYSKVRIDKTKPKKIIAPPPATIDLEKRKQKEHMMKEEQEMEQAREMPYQPLRDETEEEEPSQIKQVLSSDSQKKEILSNNSDDLGSIVTPRGPSSPKGAFSPTHAALSPISAAVSPTSASGGSRRSLTPSRRSHPWDDELAAVTRSPVNTRETSMESANGVETEYVPRKALGNDSPSRQMRRDRLAREKEQQHVREAPTSAFERELPVQSQRKQTKALTDEFDSNWVSVPPSSFFPAKSDPSQTKAAESSAWEDFRRPSKAEPPVVPKSDTDITEEVPSKAYLARANENRPSRPQGAIQTFKATTEKQDIDSLEDSSNEASARTGSIRSHEGSTSPGRFFSRKAQSEIGTPSTPTRGRFGLRNLLSRRKVELDDNDIAKRNAEKERFRSRKSASASSSRIRSRSLEEKERVARIRNPNIAKKFDRMLKVYDDEQRGPKGYI